MPTTAFTRSLGAESGVQLNPLIDKTGTPSLGDWDRRVAVVGRFTRGFIDKPFAVNQSNLRALLGKPASASLTSLNEAYSHIYEALRNGAREVVVSRLSVAAAANSWVVFTSAATSTFAVAATLPGTAYTFAVKHNACHTDGIRLSVHADTKTVSGSAVANDIVTLVVRDADSVELFRVTGSLTPGAVDDGGSSIYIPEVCELNYPGMLTWSIYTGATIGTTHDGYGSNSDGSKKFVTSAVQVAFTEGGTGYDSADYDRAISALQNGDQEFGYVITAGSRAVLLITKLVDMGYQMNRQVLIDVPGDLTVAGAVAFIGQFNFGGMGRDHIPQAYFAPLRSLDPANGNVVVWGTTGAQAGFRCARNAQTNANGLAPKNRPIAGFNFGQLGRQNVTQLLSLSASDLDLLAKAKINPVCIERYSAGALPVFRDSLTCAATTTSYRKLITVAEMVMHLEESIARYGKDQLQLPMAEFIETMDDYMDRLMTWAYAAKWLVDPDDGGEAFSWEVVRSTAEGADTALVNFWCHFDGVARRVIVTARII